jgi:hypothetical protein
LIFEKDAPTQDEVYPLGTLVRICKESYGLPERCFEDLSRTIRPEDNRIIQEDSTGMVVGYIGGWHTLMYAVMWGGDLHGRKLVVSYNKIERLLPSDCNNSSYSGSGDIDEVP